MTNNQNDDHLMTINQFQQVQKQYYRQQFQTPQRQQIYDKPIDNIPNQSIPFSSYMSPNRAEISYQSPYIPPNQQSIPLVQPQTIQSVPTFRLNNDNSEAPESYRVSESIQPSENEEPIHKTPRTFPDLPPEIKSIVSRRASRNEESRFPFKLFKLLEWAGHNQNRQNIAGCGWTSDEEFFLDKNIICHHFEIKINTLNSNLKNLGFVQTRKRQNDRTFYKNTSSTFKNASQEQDLLAIRKDKDYTYTGLQRAFFMPLLTDLELYGITHDDLNQFKKDVIIAWESIVGVMTFAIAISDFMQLMQTHFQQLQDVDFFREALSPRVPTVINIFDFAVFLSRFGPFENSIYKIAQYKQFITFLRLDLSYIGSLSPVSFYGPNFHNCFSFKLAHVGEYHCYNLPLNSINQNFLIDEDNQSFSQWYQIFQIYPSLVKGS